MIKHLIIVLLGLLPLLTLAGLGSLYHFQQYELLVAALVLLVYPIGMLMGRLFPPTQE